MTKTITRPIRQQLNMKTREVRLWFDKDRSIAPDGFYKMMGAMFLPSNIQTPEGRNRIRGYALMIGRHRESKVMYLFDEANWVTVDHILNKDDGAVLSEGLVTWCLQAWSGYFCSTYAVRQDDETQFKYTLDFSRCSMMQPKPAFIDAEWNDDTQPVSVVNRELMLKRLKMRRNSILIRELDQFRADEDAKAKNYPAVHALHCCLSTLDRYYT
jgi:hypothetical protein